MLKFVALALCVPAIWASIQPASSGLGIIGGDEARTAQFPFTAAIYHTTTTGTYFCSGALISNQWILTAAQCVVGATLFEIRLGSNSLAKKDPNRLTLATDTYVAHPDYNPETLENDVGLIKLRLPITFTDYIKPIDVLASSTLPASSIVVTVGWGQTSDEQAGLVDQLRYVYLTSLSNEECRQAFGNQVNDNEVCVDGNYNEGTCRGDSGSPLVQFGGTGAVYHVGISSFLSGNGCESPDPSGFTRTSPYRKWISNTTGIP